MILSVERLAKSYGPSIVVAASIALADSTVLTETSFLRDDGERVPATVRSRSAIDRGRRDGPA